MKTFGNIRMMRSISLILSFLLFCNVSAKNPNFKKIEDYKIKVRIAKNLKVVEVSGTDLTRKLHPIKEEKVYPGRKRVRFNCLSFARTNNLHSPMLLASLASATGLTTFGENKYQGDLHIITSKKGKSCDVVNELTMDTYISTLLAKEMNASWPIEALKAQAVAARTYAIDKMRKSALLGVAFFDLENSEKHQVNGDFFDVTNRTVLAAKQTSGLVLSNQEGKLVPAFFHASCGGSTLSPHEVWTNKIKSYKNVSCGYCKKKDNWQSIITRSRLKKMLKWAVKKKLVKPLQLEKKVFIYPDKKSNKFVHLKVGREKIKLRKAIFRRYYGRVQFPSNNFYLADGNEKGFIHFVGKGNGHGVGLCQVGSKGLAHKGWSYRRILAHYFPKMRISKVY